MTFIILCVSVCVCICEQCLFLCEILRYRAQTTPHHCLFTLINAKVFTSLSDSFYSISTAFVLIFHYLYAESSF